MADVDEILMQAEERMEKVISALSDNFASVRTGRANAWFLIVSRSTTTAFRRRSIRWRV